MLDILQKEIKEWQSSRWEYTSRPSFGLWEGDSPENLLHFPTYTTPKRRLGTTPLSSYFIPKTFSYLPQSLASRFSSPHHCLSFYFSTCLSFHPNDGTERIACLISMYVAQGQTCHLWSQLPADSLTLLSCYSATYHRILLGRILKHISLSTTFDFPARNTPPRNRWGQRNTFCS